MAIAALGALGVMLAPACGQGPSSPLTIYSGRTENLVRPLLDRFVRETGIDIDVKYGDSPNLALLIAEEGKRSPADVFLSQSPGTVGFLDEKGLLEKLDPETLEDVDSRFEAPDGRWVGVTGRVRVLVYNQDLVKEEDLPDSIFDLTESRYRGAVGIAPTNASFQDFVTAMRQVAGEQTTRTWLGGMAANRSPIYPNNNAIVEAVARGEIPLGLVNHYYNQRWLRENPRAPSRNYIFPNADIGSMLLVSTVSVLDSSDEKERAARFVRFLLTREAQEYFAEETEEYPLAAGVKPVEGLPSLESIQLPDVDLGTLGELRQTEELIAESGLGL
ncbi:MAG: iron ABC transporter substrate-binding protein [Actinomycetota bacterium]